VLRGETEVWLREEVPATRVRSSRAKSRRGDLAPAAGTTQGDVDPELRARLRSWRADIARERGVPAYVVLHDATIDGIVRAWPTTLDELRKQAETVKQKGISEYPLYMDVSKGSDQMWDFWMYTFASGGHLLNQAGEPTFPDTDKVPLAILEWWVAAANDWKIMNAQANMEVPTAGALTPLRTQGSQPGYGGVAFAAHSRYDLEADNAPERSKSAIPGKINIKFVLFPGLDASSPHNVPAWNRYYGIPSTAPNRTASMDLIKYLGDKDEVGLYYTAKRWWLLRAVGRG